MILSRRGHRLRRLGMIGAAKLPFLRSAAPPIWATLTPIAVLLPSATTMFSDAAMTIPCASGDPVYWLADQSGHGNHVSQPTLANRPIAILSGGFWRLRGNGSTAFMFRSSLNGWTGTNGFVSSRFGINGTGSQVTPIQTTGETSNGDYYHFSGGGAYARNLRSGRFDNAFASVDSGIHTYTQTSDSTYTLFDNGVQTATTAAAWESPSALQLLVVDTTGFANIDLAGVVLGASVLGSNRAALETFMATLLA